VTQVVGEVLPQLAEFAVRVAVEALRRLRHRGDDGGVDIGGDAVGVLVDVQQDGYVQLRGAVGVQPDEVITQGKVR
jgi:glutamate synthase domain-containing protein 1